MKRLPERLADWQHGRSWVFVVVALLLSAASLPLIRELGLNSAFTALLPEHKESIQDLEQVGDRIGGLSTLFVAIQAEDVEAMQRFARDLVPRLNEIDDDNLVSVDWNVASFEDFVTDNKHFYADLDDLQEVRDALSTRIEYEHCAANPFCVQLDDEEPPDPGEIVERMRRRADEGRARLERFPGGFYVHTDRDLLAVFLRTNIGGGDVASGNRLIAKVDAEVQALDPSSYADDLHVEYAGDLLHQREEHDAIARELITATSITVVLVLIVIVIFFRRARSVPLIGLSLMVPVLVTFAFAELTVDYLNTSTAFLGSIVIGNGINPQIIWLARYFEVRRGGAAVREALVETHRSTWGATLTASLAAAIAYGSLVITDFRGFQDFGIIGGVGMVLCWIAAYTLLGAFASLSERARPVYTDPEKAKGSFYGVLFARMVAARPKAIVVGSVLLTVAGVALVAKAVVDDPIEYDFRNLRSVREGTSRASVLNGRIKEIVGGSGIGQANLLLVDDDAEVAPLRAQLERRRDEGGAPYGRVRSIADLLPKDQEAKVPVLEAIRELMADVRRYADEEELAKLDEHALPDELVPLSAADLPEDVARPFSERDGTRGRVILVEQSDGYSLWDGQYLVAWAQSLREARLLDGETRPPLAGRAPVFADMIEVIWVDGPKAILASLLATLLLVVVSFRDGRQRALTMASLLLGIVWMAGTMAAAGMKLNFLNFVAFPITFGNGVDYGVNLMRRYGIEHSRGLSVLEAVRASIEETGGAVILCSLTTIIGYTSLYVSANKALNSFGAAMAISEITCVLAATLAVPAILVLLARRGGRVDGGTGSANTPR